MSPMLVFGLIVGTACAFHAPASISRRKLNNVHSAVKMNVGATLAAIPLMYSLMSANEYVTHRYYQHTDFNKAAIAKKLNLKIKGGGHVEHHAETLDDMSLKSDSRWRSSPAAKLLNADKYRGTAFNWEVTAWMGVQMLATCVPVMKLLLGFSALKTIAWIIPSLLLHTTVWNALHPEMHGLPSVPLSHGPPTSLFSWLRGSKFFNFLYLNHQGHHVVGGQGNYNVCCPGVDHLVGTFVPEKVWRPKMRIQEAVDAAESPAVDADSVARLEDVYMQQ